jgi:hypothetical protein
MDNHVFASPALADPAPECAGVRQDASCRTPSGPSDAAGVWSRCGLAIVALVVCLVIAGSAQAHRLSGKPKTIREKLAQARAQLRHDRAEGANHWRARDRRYLRLLTHPPHLRQWLCIHHYEGSWTDSGFPHWGGLQMDLGFQRTYGPAEYRRYGTADHWTPLEQMWAAERAWVSRGFYPWPNTARYCGLI